MRLLFITCLKDDQSAVAAILNRARIRVFSVSETVGYRENGHSSLIDSWFSTGEENYDSIFIFSFTSPESADEALEQIKTFNSRRASDYPIRGFILPVEKSTYED